MRVILALLGALVAAIGLVLLFVPLAAQPAAVVPAATGPPTYDVGKVPGASLTGQIPIVVTWSATSYVTVIGGVCTSPCTNDSQLSDVTIQNGTSGSFAVNQPVNGETFVGANTSGNTSGTVTFKLTTALTTEASLLIIVGLIVVIVGVFLGPPKPKSSGVSAPAPASTPAPAPPPAP